MRKTLAEREGVRKKFFATFSRTGKKTNFNGFSEDTILLTDIRDAESGEVVTGHLWFSYTKAFDKIALRPGIILSFEARVKQYKKGYINRSLGMTKRSIDFRLSHPTKITEVKS